MTITDEQFDAILADRDRYVARITELEAAIKTADDSITNMLPHIDGCCYPGKESFLLDHIEVALEALRATEKGTE